MSQQAAADCTSTSIAMCSHDGLAVNLSGTAAKASQQCVRPAHGNVLGFYVPAAGASFVVLAAL